MFPEFRSFAAYFSLLLSDFVLVNRLFFISKIFWERGAEKCPTPLSVSSAKESSVGYLFLSPRRDYHKDINVFA